MLTISQAAKALGVCKFTLRRWEKAGKIVSKRTIGGHRRYPNEWAVKFSHWAQKDVIKAVLG